jgi:flagellar biosynthesis/type III secretory pathway protein FliH
MASIEARIGELVAENRNLRQWLTEESSARKKDHDKITELEALLKTYNDKIDELEQFQRGVEDASRAKLEAALAEGKADGKDQSSRRWQVVIEIIGALAAALVGGIAAKWIFK